MSKQGIGIPMTSTSQGSRLITVAGIVVALIATMALLIPQGNALDALVPVLAGDSGDEVVDPYQPKQAENPGEIQSLGSQASPVVFRHDIKGELTWFMLNSPEGWYVWPEQITGLRVTSIDQAEISSRYGLIPTTTWGVFDAYITNEPGLELGIPEAGITTTTSAYTIGGYLGVRRDFEDSLGRIDATVAVTLPAQSTNTATPLTYVFNTQVAGAAGTEATTLRNDLDNILQSVQFIPDHTNQVGWTRSEVSVASSVGNGFDIFHPIGWTVAGMSGSGAVNLSSPIGLPYTSGVLSVYITPASTQDAARWPNESRWPYRMLRHETRSTSPVGLTTPMPIIPSSTFLVRDANGEVWLIAVSNPAQTFGSGDFWFYDQVIYRITTDSTIAYDVLPYP